MIDVTHPLNVCRASAGTGKTYTLAAYYVGLLLSGEDYRSILAITFTNKATAEMSERILPTGNLLPLSAEEQKLVGEGLDPLYADMDDHFTAKPFDCGFNGAVLTHKEEGTRVTYQVDPFYKHWMVWNSNQEGSFVCIEPQNWRVNAPNLPIPAEESGMACIEAGETLSVKACVKAEKI